MIKNTSLLLGFLFLSFSGFSQTHSEIFSYDVKAATTTFSKQTKQFFLLNQPGYAYFAAPVLFFLTTPFDEQVREFSQSFRIPYYEIPDKIGYGYGRPETSLLISAALYTQGLTNENNKNRVLGSQVFQSVFYSTAIVGIGKVILGRKRPYTHAGPNNFWNFSFFNDDWMSHPSGHSAISFALSNTLAHYSSAPMKGIWYGLAANTAFSRIYDDDHWFSDVVVGAFIGIAVSNFVLNQTDNYYKQGSSFSGGQVNLIWTGDNSWFVTF